MASAFSTAILASAEPPAVRFALVHATIATFSLGRTLSSQTTPRVISTGTHSRQRILAVVLVAFKMSVRLLKGDYTSNKLALNRLSYEEAATFQDVYNPVHAWVRTMTKFIGSAF